MLMVPAAATGPPSAFLIASVAAVTMLASCAGTDDSEARHTCAQLLADPDPNAGQNSSGLQYIDPKSPNIPLQVRSLLKFLDDTFTAAESSYDSSLDAGQKAAQAQENNYARARFRKVYAGLNGHYSDETHGEPAAAMASKLAFIWIACLENPARTVSRKSLNVGCSLERVADKNGMRGLDPPVEGRARAIRALQRHASALPAKVQLAAAYYVLRGYGYMDGFIPNSLFREAGVDGYLTRDEDGRVKAELKGVARQFPQNADTMHTLSQLFQIQHLLTSTIGAGVPGSFLQAGVWRGGGGVAAALVLQAMQPARGAGAVAAPIRSSGNNFFEGLKKLIVTDNTYRRSPGLAGGLLRRAAAGGGGGGPRLLVEDPRAGRLARRSPPRRPPSTTSCVEPLVAATVLTGGGGQVHGRASQFGLGPADRSQPLQAVAAAKLELGTGLHLAPVPALLAISHFGSMYVDRSTGRTASNDALGAP